MAAETNIDQCKIVTVTGPKEGVGKTILALNLANLRAAQTGRGVVLIEADPLCREALLSWMGITQLSAVPTLKSLVDFYARAGGGPKAVDMVRGKILFARAGVAAVPLGFQPKEVLGNFDPQHLNNFLRGLGRCYDIVIDSECAYAFLPFALEISDWVYWVILPQRQCMTATIGVFEDLKVEHFPLDRIEVVVNQYNLPGAMQIPEIERYLYAYNKKVKFRLPWEDEIPQAANTGGYLLTNNAGSEWAKVLRFVANQIRDIKPKSAGGNFADLLRYLGTNNGFWKLDGAGAAGAPAAKPDAAAPAQPAAGQVEMAAFQMSADPKWNKLKEEIHGKVVMEMAVVKTAGEAQRRQRVEQIVNSELDKRPETELTREQREKFVTELMDDIMGLGPLEVILRDPKITEIMVNAHDKIYIEMKGKLTMIPVRFRSDDQLIEVIRKIVAPLGRRVDESSPLVDARLKDGSRVNAVIPPLAVSGPTLTIRRFSAKPLTYDQLIAMGALTKEVVDFTKACVFIAKNVVISGGTGSGKTTFLNMCSSFIPEDDRILTIEDVAELRLQQPHWVRLETRPPNIEGKGEVAIRDLVKSALRMRPDRIVVGECRGGEAIDMLQAMNTGHDGSMTTIHANTPRDALNRVETMCLMSGMDLPVWVLREMIASAIHIICQLSRLEDGSRRITSVTEIIGRDDKGVNTQEIFKFVQTGISPEGKVIGYHTATGVIPNVYKTFVSHGVDIPKEIFTPKEPAKEEEQTPVPAPPQPAAPAA
ncbi:MAG: Flp pilus assembly complex ATPase component TadA [Elusimicrobia bacterium]|nr:Flp pilus assembly complex ATPase component TadA [Elusimicrobiota bacterium]